jgi:hypothetical protein
VARCQGVKWEKGGPLKAQEERHQVAKSLPHPPPRSKRSSVDLVTPLDTSWRGSSGPAAVNAVEVRGHEGRALGCYGER